LQSRPEGEILPDGEEEIMSTWTDERLDRPESRNPGTLDTLGTSIDLNAYTGFWPSLPLTADVAGVRGALQSYGVEQVCLSPLAALWGHNPHRANRPLLEETAAYDDVWPVPVLDPTVATWRKELDSLAEHPRVRLVKLHPNYHGYDLDQADELLAALTERGLAAAVQTRMEDPRRQYPQAQVPDVPAEAVIAAAERHPDLTVILGGARWNEIRALGPRLLAGPRLYADTSQADGMDSLALLCAEGLTERLVFGSHAPLFIPYSALARVVTDLDDDAVAAILGGNVAWLMADG
jgi:predicted TIM-barrel fold metal-dependent hydrolase